MSNPGAVVKARCGLALGATCAIAVLWTAACGAKQAAQPQSSEAAGPSAIRVTPGQNGIVIDTETAQFVVRSSGYVEAHLRGRSAPSTLDEPGDDPGQRVIANGTEIGDVALELAHPRVAQPEGKLGRRGKRVEIAGKSASSGLEELLVVEAYDELPNLALVSATFRNVGARNVHLDEVDLNRHRLSASLPDASVASYQMWSFHGASIQWGKDNVFQIPREFSQENPFGAPVEVKGDLGRVGGGIPVVAFWTRTVGEAIGHVETLPLMLSIPVETGADGRVRAAVRLRPEATLRPNESYATPRTFVAVYSGDYYEPLQMYSEVIDREGLTRVKDTDEDYAVSWCGWGYEANVTPAQMVDTIPKLKGLGIHWATLDDRWFDNYGDWNPRADTFPNGSLRTMVEQFHAQGMKVQLWWLPLAVEDGGGSYESHRYGVSQVVKEHREWLVLDKDGKPARMARNLATLCPAVPQVRAYYKQLTERFIRDWDFDGHKLDNIYSVPPCYNPAHHHRSPYDSVYAMGEVYKTIFETTRALKPESVTQSCPCGTPPSVAWLRYMDQAVTADPVGATHVRQRIKMYKALLGPRAAIYGDHVELTRITGVNQNERDLGTDFASTLGAGGVLGTKFTWPDYGPKFKDVYLTKEKEAHWKKWIALYNQKMLSRGEFLNLYVYGYDVPEAYAIEKDGAMYYAFFAPPASGPRAAGGGSEWTGTIELRGLGPGAYHVMDYVDGKDYGEVTGPTARFNVRFPEHLLLEAAPAK